MWQAHDGSVLSLSLLPILALAGIDEQGDKLTITVNHPTTGNTQVEVTNTAANKRTVKEGWKSSFDVNVFDPEHCPAS